MLEGRKKGETVRGDQLWENALVFFQQRPREETERNNCVQEYGRSRQNLIRLKKIKVKTGNITRGAQQEKML